MCGPPQMGPICRSGSLFSAVMTDISPLAAGVRARFGTAAAHATVRTGRTVHAVQLGQWVGAELAPELLCHTGVSGWDPDVLRETLDPVTCARCLRILGASVAPAATQLPLFGVEPRSGAA